MIAAYVLWGLTAFFCAGLALKYACTSYKDLKAFSAQSDGEITSHPAAQSVNKQDSEPADPEALPLLSDTEPSETWMLGYKSTLWGYITLWLVIATSVCWVLLYLLLIVDFYWDCDLKGVDSLCFYGKLTLRTTLSSEDRFTSSVRGL